MRCVVCRKLLSIASEQRGNTLPKKVIDFLTSHSAEGTCSMKKRAARPAKSNSKPEEFKYAPNTSSKKVAEEKITTITTPETLSDDDDYNSGFGSYLRSPEGFSMLKLFVLANSVVMILTLAWPNTKELISYIRENFWGDDDN